MRRLCLALTLAFALLFPALALGETRALLVACSDFVTQPDLGSAASGNLQMIGSALVGASPRLAGLSIEDGTVGTPQALEAAVEAALGDAAETDLSILYLCTHGILSSADDGEAYLLLGDGETETPLSASALCRIVSRIQGEKLLILDACFSGALIGRGVRSERTSLLPGARATDAATPFLSDPSIHVLTSADGGEAGWYYDSDRLATGAVSYFASALSTALGLYGAGEADASGDGVLTLAELYAYLRAAVPSSTCQLLSRGADGLALPTAQGAMLSRPLTRFTYGASLLPADDPVLDFSFTVSHETLVQYRLVEYGDGGWDWAGARTFLDEEAPLSPGRQSRSLTLSGLSDADSGYLMLQVFSVSGEAVALCSERLLAVQGDAPDAALSIALETPGVHPGTDEVEIALTLPVPAEVSVCVYDAQGSLVRRVASGALTRPSRDGATRFYWDGRDDSGEAVAPGDYVVTAETVLGGRRQKAAANVRVGP